eukprot:3024498-Pyramimonas_sp.AAC.2
MPSEVLRLAGGDDSVGGGGGGGGFWRRLSYPLQTTRDVSTGRFDVSSMLLSLTSRTCPDEQGFRGSVACRPFSGGAPACLSQGLVGSD